MYKVLLVTLVALMCAPAIFAQREDITLTQTQFVQDRLVLNAQYSQTNFLTNLCWGIFTPNCSTTSSFVVFELSDLDMLRSNADARVFHKGFNYIIRIDIDANLPRPDCFPKGDEWRSGDMTSIIVFYPPAKEHSPGELFEVARTFLSYYLSDHLQNSSFVPLYDEK